MTETTYEKLNADFRAAKANLQLGVRKALVEWLNKNGNIVEVPPKYRKDFYFTIEGEEKQVTAIVYYENTKMIYLVLADGEREHAWVYAEEDSYIVESVMNLYFGREPMFLINTEME
jgi:hypothetical protein